MLLAVLPVIVPSPVVVPSLVAVPGRCRALTGRRASAGARGAAGSARPGRGAPRPAGAGGGGRSGGACELTARRARCVRQRDEGHRQGDAGEEQHTTARTATGAPVRGRDEPAGRGAAGQAPVTRPIAWRTGRAMVPGPGAPAARYSRYALAAGGPGRPASPRSPGHGLVGCSSAPGPGPAPLVGRERRGRPGCAGRPARAWRGRRFGATGCSAAGRPGAAGRLRRRGPAGDADLARLTARPPRRWRAAHRRPARRAKLASLPCRSAQREHTEIPARAAR